MNCYFKIVLLLFIPFFSFCAKVDIVIDNGDEEVEVSISKELVPAVNRFIELSCAGSESEVFLFFTDPHLMTSFDSEFKKRFISSFSTLKEIWEVLPLSFCISGGDWLNSGDTQELAKQKLLFADSQMKSLFSNYHKIMGNHDTNYQGIVSENDSSRGDLPRSFIDKEYFVESGSAYYSFMGENTQFFVLDSELDWYLALNDYKYEQLKWLAKQLQLSGNKHFALCTHMFYSSTELVPMSEEIVRLCDSYNQRRICTVDEVEYDYTHASGTIHAIFSGHNHRDSISFVGVNMDIPVIQTCNFTIENSHSFDICVLNYESGLLDLIRIGKGENRHVKMTM